MNKRLPRLSNIAKKLLSILIAIAVALSVMIGTVPVLTRADSTIVVTIGADLTDEQKNIILSYFNILGRSDYTSITVTNDDEMSYLGNYMSRDIIGYRTISCAMIRPMTSGGIQVKTANLTYVTSNMIASNLATAGVTNCEVLAAAPFQVSGTGALTGTLMAYANLSGVTIDESKKEAATQEFATTYELGQTIGQQEAQQIVNDVKLQVIEGTLIQGDSITEEEITNIVNDVVNNYFDNSTTNNITNNTTNNTTVNNTGLSEEDYEALEKLASKIAEQSYEQGTVDALAQIQKTLEGQTQTSSTAATQEIVESASSTTDTSGLTDVSSAQTTATSTADTSADDTSATNTDTADTSSENISSSSTDSIQSAADEALSSDSILKDTNDEALSSTSDDGTVVVSSTAESTIDTASKTVINLDQQIEEEQAAAETAAETTDTSQTTAETAAETTDTSQTTAETDAESASSSIDTSSLGNVIPEPTDSTVLIVDGSSGTGTDIYNDTPETTAETVAETTAETVAETTAETVAETTAETVAEATAETVAETTVLATITAADISSGNAQLVSYSETSDGSSEGSGVAPIALILPYDNLVPVEGTIRIFDNSGVEVANLSIDDPSIYPDDNIMTVARNDTVSVPAGWDGYTEILVIAEDVNTGEDFSPVAGGVYSFTFEGEFVQTTDLAQISTSPVLNVAIDNYTPYYYGATEAGFSVDSFDLNDMYWQYGAEGSVLFPSDGSAAYAVISADSATVSVDGQEGGIPEVDYGTEASVAITPFESGKITLTITYYASQEDTATPVQTVNYSIQFTDD